MTVPTHSTQIFCREVHTFYTTLYSCVHREHVEHEKHWYTGCSIKNDTLTVTFSHNFRINYQNQTLYRKLCSICLSNLEVIMWHTLFLTLRSIQLVWDHLWTEEFLNLCHIMAHIFRPTEPNWTRFSANCSKLLVHNSTILTWKFICVGLWYWKVQLLITTHNFHTCNFRSTTLIFFSRQTDVADLI